MPPFEKGHTKVGGRKSGTPNKKTVQRREALDAFLTNYIGSDLMAEDFESLEPRDRLIIAEKYLPYVEPKKTTSDLNIHTDADGPTLEQRLAALASGLDPSDQSH